MASFTRAKFLGASVRSFSSSMGWGLGQQSQVTIPLVVDARDGDSLNITDAHMGQPCHFEFYQFKFSGLLQKFEKTNDQQGFPTYEAVLVDPREVLDGCQLIVNNYSGAVTGIPNLVNVFGYWENLLGFGGSGANSTGMPWSKVLAGANALINGTAATPFGGPLTFRGVRYSLDLSQLPSAPPYYRIGGGGASVGLLEMVAQLCDDGGCDFFVELSGFTIRIRTVRRRTQPPLGTIAALASTNWDGTVVRSRAGMEVRNETASAFLVGGEVTTLHQTEGLRSFWGYDQAGNPILGTVDRFDFVDNRTTARLLADLNATATNPRLEENGPAVTLPIYIRLGREIIQVTSRLGDDRFRVVRGAMGTTAASHRAGEQGVRVWGTTPTEYMDLNALRVADLIGSAVYSCSTLEMRMALVNFESWALFVRQFRPDIANRLNLFSPLANMGAQGLMLPPNLINDAPLMAALIGAAQIAGGDYARQQQVYDFVRGFASGYLGKKWAVPVPFVLHKQDPDTLRVSASYEVSDGGYLPDGATPLGLSTYNEDTFRNVDGTFRSFVNFTSLTGAELGTVPPGDSVVENGVLFLGCQVDPNLIFTPAPAVVVTLGEGLFDAAVDTVGDLNIMASVLMMTPAQARRTFEAAAFGATIARVFPAPRTPTAAAVPLRSKVLTYGPWFAVGGDGKVRVENDPGLVPWEYGGYENMNLVGASKVAEAVTFMQVAEAGTIELASPPTASLGDVLQANGPNITNINVSFGQNGVSTSYAFQTFTQPRLNGFSKGQADRIKRSNQTAMELRRAVRASMRQSERAGRQLALAGNANRAFLQNAPPAIQLQTPHEMLVASTAVDTDGSVRTGASSATYKEALAFVRANDPDQFRSTAAMSVGGLVRPFATATGVGLNMPALIPSPLNTALNASGLNPWKGQNDIECYTWGQTYEGLHAQRRGADLATVRAIGLRAPLMLTGWGYDWQGNPTPSGGDGGWVSGYLTRSDLHKAGPLDALWDETRGVWTCHDAVRCRTRAGLAASGSVAADMLAGTGLAGGPALTLHNFTANAVASGEQVMALFSALDNRWYALTQSPAVPGSGGSSGSGITVEGSSTYSPVSTLRFSQLFSVSQPSAGVARVDMPAASPTVSGVVSFGAQSFAGDKTFDDDVVANRLGVQPNGDPLRGRFSGGVGGGGTLVQLDLFDTAGSAPVGSYTASYGSGDFVFAISSDDVTTTDAKFRVNAGGNTYDGATGTDPVGNQFKGGIVHTIGSGAGLDFTGPLDQTFSTSNTSTPATTQTTTVTSTGTTAAGFGGNSLVELELTSGAVANAYLQSVIWNNTPTSGSQISQVSGGVYYQTTLQNWYTTVGGVTLPATTLTAAVGFPSTGSLSTAPAGYLTFPQVTITGTPTMTLPEGSPIWNSVDNTFWMSLGGGSFQQIGGGFSGDLDITGHVASQVGDSYTFNADVDDWGSLDAGDFSILIDCGTGTRDFTGIATPTSGRWLSIRVTNGTLVLKHNDSASTAGNRFKTPTGSDWVVPVGSSVILFYDGFDWLVIGQAPQYSTTGTTTGFTAGAGTAVKDDSVFSGNVGGTAYTIGDIVMALKLAGTLAM